MTSIVTDRYAIYNADTVEVARQLADHSVGFSVFSPPFVSLFSYSDSPRDFSNCTSYEDFFEHYDYLVREQARVMMPGRLVAIHCMQLPTSKERDGYIGLRDFRGDIIRAYQKRGFIYASEVTIWKDPVIAMMRTKALGLLHKQLRKDSSMSRQGIPDYLVVMRAPGENPEPIAHTHEQFPVEMWQRYASPVWMHTRGVDDEGFVKPCEPGPGSEGNGILQTDTLQARSAREDADEKHLCPLQTEVIRRAVRLWSNPGDVVWTPFMGIGSEVVTAVQEGRRGLGVELKNAYFVQASRNVADAVKTLGTLF